MPIVSPWSKVTCPYCFERFHLRKSLYRDTTPGLPTVADPMYGAFFGMNPPSLPPIRVKPKAGFLSDVLVPTPGHNDRMICPNCHIPLPDKVSSGEARGEVIAIIGARNSGKSNFFGVLMRQLRRRYMEELSFDLLEADTQGPTGRLSTGDLYQKRYGQYLFSSTDPRAVPQTMNAGASRIDELDPRIPLVYMMRFRKRGLQHLTHPRMHRMPVYLMIYDAAGEDLMSGETLEQSYRFLTSATSLVFLIDPFDFPGLRSLLPEDIRNQLPPPMPEPTQIVGRVLSLFQSPKARNTPNALKAGRQSKIPVAFALTKSDLFEKAPGLVEPGSLIAKDSRHRGGFDARGCDALHQEIVERIRRYDSTELLQLADSYFPNHRFFALSALGAMPKNDGAKKLTKDITPNRIADPLLWLLWQRGFIPALKS